MWPDYPLVGEYNFRTTGSEDFKWIIYDAGTYRITVDNIDGNHEGCEAEQ